MSDKPNTAGLDSTQLTHLKQQLLAALTALRTRRSGQLADHTNGIAEVEDEADQAFRAGDEETLSVLAESERERIAEIEHALEKFDTGEYGLDEDTDEPIGFARLSVVPWARFAVTTQEDRERRG
jgi:RNA polymerase-binding transcription factor DksA